MGRGRIDWVHLMSLAQANQHGINESMVGYVELDHVFGGSESSRTANDSNEKLLFPTE